MRVGTADLPLHYGQCPKWLFNKMVRLASAINEIIIDEFGHSEYLRRISNPYFFQSLGCALGFDWHSSGLTTTVCAALKESFSHTDLGLYAEGGKGKHALSVPDALSSIKTSNLSDSVRSKLIYASRMSAKVDNAVLQDGYQLYHHMIFFTDKGDWAVIQQGMHAEKRYARRYHWLKDTITKGFVNEPHTAICCDSKSEHVLDLTSSISEESRKISVDIVNDFGSGISKEWTKVKEPRLRMPIRHWVMETDLTNKDITFFSKVKDISPGNYEELVSIRGMGPKRIRALALISHLIYGSDVSWNDPVKFSYSHGGKDGTPYPVDVSVYENTIRFLKDAIEQSRLNTYDRKRALARLMHLTNVW